MQARRTVASVKILSELGVRLGSTRSALLMGSSILPAQLDDPHLEIDPDQELQVIHNLVRLHGKVPGLGLMAGAEYQPNLQTGRRTRFALSRSHVCIFKSRIGAGQRPGIHDPVGRSFAPGSAFICG